jgi:4-hydroxy-2-oxoglutarate aldolase
LPDPRVGHLGGVLVPVTTPFDPVTEEVAPIPFRENLRRWLEAPIDGIVLFGSTGEGKLLVGEEKLRLMGYARDLVPVEMPLVVGIGEESTRQNVRQIRQLAEAGADAVLLSPPSYFGSTLTAGALRDHYLAIAETSPIPIVVYHIPKFTHVVLEAGLVSELARHPNIVAIKDSSGDVKRLAEFTDVCEGRCSVLVGNGALLYTALELGAAGGIIALGLLASRACTEIVRLFREGRTRDAGAIQTRLAPVHREIVARHGAAGVKAALELIGFGGGRTRRPLPELTEKERRKVARVMQQAGLI